MLGKLFEHVRHRKHHGSLIRGALIALYSAETSRRPRSEGDKLGTHSTPMTSSMHQPQLPSNNDPHFSFTFSSSLIPTRTTCMPLMIGEESILKIESKKAIKTGKKRPNAWLVSPSLLPLLNLPNGFQLYFVTRGAPETDRRSVTIIKHIRIGMYERASGRLHLSCVFANSLLYTT